MYRASSRKPSRSSRKQPPHSHHDSHSFVSRPLSPDHIFDDENDSASPYIADDDRNVYNNDRPLSPPPSPNLPSIEFAELEDDIRLTSTPNPKPAPLGLIEEFSSLPPQPRIVVPRDAENNRPIRRERPSCSSPGGSPLRLRSMVFGAGRQPANGIFLRRHLSLDERDQAQRQLNQYRMELIDDIPECDVAEFVVLDDFCEILGYRNLPGPLTDPVRVPYETRSSPLRKAWSVTGEDTMVLGDETRYRTKPARGGRSMVNLWRLIVERISRSG